MTAPFFIVLIGVSIALAIVLVACALIHSARPCPKCKGVRFKTCLACGESANSYHDFREYELPKQVYETFVEYRAVNGDPEQSIPDRRLQP